MGSRIDQAFPPNAHAIVTQRGFTRTDRLPRFQLRGCYFIISFTGSTEVGRILMAQSAPTIKKLSLEHGGNAPFIVFDHADIDSAAEGAMASKYRNAGQTCVCANRIYVQDGVYDQFVAKLAEKVKALKVGISNNVRTRMRKLAVSGYEIRRLPPRK